MRTYGLRWRSRALTVVRRLSQLPGTITLETALRQAEERGHSLETEIRVLLLHGLLHLAGYDHEVDDGAMHRKETRLRRQLGLRAGLIERTHAKPARPQPARRRAVRT